MQRCSRTVVLSANSDWNIANFRPGLIRALKGARNNLVDLEKLSDDELKKLEEQFTKLRQHAESATKRVSELEQAR